MLAEQSGGSPGIYLGRIHEPRNTPVKLVRILLFNSILKNHLTLFTIFKQ